MNTADIRWKWESEDEENEAVETTVKTAVKEIERIVGDPLTDEQVEKLYQLIRDLIDPIPF